MALVEIRHEEYYDTGYSNSPAVDLLGAVTVCLFFSSRSIASAPCEMTSDRIFFIGLPDSI